MSESNEATEPAAETAAGDTPQGDEGTKPEIDWKAKSREWEKRAKANADAQAKLEAIEESQKTETQRLADAKDAAEKAAATAQSEALRWRIAAKHSISDEDADIFLTGADEETLTRQAQRLTEMAQTASEQPSPGPRPDLSQGSHAPSAGDPAADFASFINAQLG